MSSCGSTTSKDPVKQKYAECEWPHGTQPEVPNDRRKHPLGEPMVPLPWNTHQGCGANDDGPADEPEHLGLPHGRREHDKRRPDQQATHLLYVVRARGACETHQESLGNRRLREGHARECNEHEAKRDDHESGQQAHGLAGALKSRMSVEPPPQLR